MKLKIIIAIQAVFMLGFINTIIHEKGVADQQRVLAIKKEENALKAEMKVEKLEEQLEKLLEKHRALLEACKGE